MRFSALKPIVFLTVLLLARPLRAQFYTTGSDPSRLKWSQVEVPGFRIIYPRGLDSLAFNYADLLHHQTRHSLEGLNGGFGEARRTKSFGSRGSLPVVLHAYSAQQNGMVVWAPRRMELYTIPASEGTPLDWPLNLAIHEGRHVAQMQKAGEGLFKGLHYALGEQSEGLAAAVLDFFSPGLLEGDAVWAETRYSQSGRGRQADFLMPYKALFLDSILYSYDKFHFGSFKDFIPNEYALGYLQLSAAPGAGNAAGIFEGISRNPFRYNSAYRESVGCSVKELWDNAVAHYSTQWKKQADTAAPFDRPRLLSPPEKRYVRYAWPISLNGTVYAVRSSMGETGRIVSIDGHALRKCCLTGNINSPLTGAGNTLYWTETVSSGRWEHETFSLLTSYHTATGKRSVLSHRTRYFNPSVSPDGRRVALAEYLPDGHTRLVTYLTEIDRFHTVCTLPAGTTLKETVWKDDHTLIATLQYPEGLSLCAIDFASGALSPLVAPQHRTLRRLSVHGDTLYFDSDLNGTDNLYACRLSDRTLFRLTNARSGAFQPYACGHGDTLLYTSYSHKGYEVAALPLSDCHVVQEDFNTPEPTLFDAWAAAHPDTVAAAAAAADISLEAKPYSKLSHLFKFHSWAPLYYEKDELSTFNMERYYDAVSLGASLFTQNDLGTAYGQLGYSYHHHIHEGHLKFTYTGLYPVLSASLRISNGNTARVSLLNDSIVSEPLGAPSYQGQLLAYIPFTLHSGGWVRQFVPSLRWQFSNRQYRREGKESLRENLLLARLQWNDYRAMTSCDLFPRLGYGLQAQYLTFPEKEQMFTRLLYASAQVYLPGFFRNNAFRIKGALQTQMVPSTTHTVLYVGNLLSIRGLKDVIAPEMYSWSIDYAFPVNLDWSIPGFLYLKRLEMIPFYDGIILRNPYRQESRPAHTAGVEASANFHFLRINSSLTAGIRGSFNSLQGNTFEFILSVPYL